jgi:hypothetical protein
LVSGTHDNALIVTNHNRVPGFSMDERHTVCHRFPKLL